MINIETYTAKKKNGAWFTCSQISLIITKKQHVTHWIKYNILKLKDWNRIVLCTLLIFFYLQLWNSRLQDFTECVKNWNAFFFPSHCLFGIRENLLKQKWSV